MRRYRTAGFLHPILTAAFLLFVAADAYPCTPRNLSTANNSAQQGEMSRFFIAESGNFFPVEIVMGSTALMTSNYSNPTPTRTEFDLTVPAGAPPGVYTTRCFVGSAFATGTFTVLPAATATPPPTFTSRRPEHAHRDAPGPDRHADSDRPGSRPRPQLSQAEGRSRRRRRARCGSRRTSSRKGRAGCG